MLERFHFEGDEGKTFLKNDVTAQLFLCSENFLVLKCPSGSGAAQLPHEHFKNKKFSLEVSQPEDGLFEKNMSGSQRNVRHIIVGSASGHGLSASPSSSANNLLLVLLPS